MIDFNRNLPYYNVTSAPYRGISVGGRRLCMHSRGIVTSRCHGLEGHNYSEDLIWLLDTKEACSRPISLKHDMCA